jgi:mannose-6-phosphate isomerase
MASIRFGFQCCSLMDASWLVAHEWTVDKMNLTAPRILQLTPEYRDYVWGGQRLRPGRLTAEAWVIYEQDRIASGPWAGRILGEVCAEQGASLLGERALERTGGCFPLLIKLLDCAQWLSLQVHPNDEQATRLEGPGHSGKTEAWHILGAAAEAQIIAGLKTGTTASDLEQAVGGGSILDIVQFLPVRSGDTVYMRAGTVHALGPGLLVYEVQQTSDLTYRLFDWNRPQTGGRVLHVEKSLAVADPAIVWQAIACPPLEDGDCRVLCRSGYFLLEILNATTRVVESDTRGETFHALTVTSGSARLVAGDEAVTLGLFESVIVPAGTGPYHLEPLGAFRALRCSLP